MKTVRIKEGDYPFAWYKNHIGECFKCEWSELWGVIGL